MEISSSAEEEVEFINCESCGFTEECTVAYISRIRQRYCGMWLCGLCIEAVKAEVLKSERLISTEEALNRHISFCRNFQSTSPPSSSEHPMFAMGKLLRKSLDTPRSLRSSSSCPVREVNQSSLVRSASCFSSLPSWWKYANFQFKRIFDAGNRWSFWLTIQASVEHKIKYLALQQDSSTPSLFLDPLTVCITASVIRMSIFQHKKGHST